MVVNTPDGKLLGTIKQQWACCKPKLAVKDSQGKTLFKIKGPCCVVYNVDFPVTKGGTEVGVIKKKWGGWGAEAITDADVYEMEFKQALSVEEKALLLAVILL